MNRDLARHSNTYNIFFRIRGESEQSYKKSREKAEFLTLEFLESLQILLIYA